MSFSDADVTAYIDGNSQRTKEITFNADELQTITMKLPNGVKFHNVTTGKTSAAGASVEVSGGTKFYLSAPLTQAEDVKDAWSVTMKGSITKDFSAYKITTGSGTQDLALVFGEGVDDEKYVDFKVSWVKVATVEIIKKDSQTGNGLAGAVYGIYSDKDCTKLIAQMPATDSNGASSLMITKTASPCVTSPVSLSFFTRWIVPLTRSSVTFCVTVFPSTSFTPYALVSIRYPAGTEISFRYTVSCVFVIIRLEAPLLSVAGIWAISFVQSLSL